jgi:hypothetical protein
MGRALVLAIPAGMEARLCLLDHGPQENPIPETPAIAEELTLPDAAAVPGEATRFAHEGGLA